MSKWGIYYNLEREKTRLSYLLLFFYYGGWFGFLMNELPKLIGPSPIILYRYGTYLYR